MIPLLILVSALAIVWLLRPDEASNRSASRWYVVVFVVFALGIAWSNRIRGWTAPWSAARVARVDALEVRASQLAVLREARRAAIAERSAERARDRLAAVRAKEAFVVDARVEPEAAEVVRELVESEIVALALPREQLRVLVTPPLIAAPPRGPRSQRALDLTWVLPAADGEPCVVVVEVQPRPAADLRVARSTSVTGPCAFVARFGRPGPWIAQWLARVDYGPALVPVWNDPSRDEQAVASPGRRLRRTELKGAAAACLVGGDRECGVALGVISERTDSGATSGGDVVSIPTGTAFSRAGSRLGVYERVFLAELAARHGAERFREFWRASDAVPAAFARVYGEDVSRYTRRWLALAYDDRPGGPAVPAGAILMGLGAVALASAAAVRRTTRLVG